MLVTKGNNQYLVNIWSGIWTTQRGFAGYLDFSSLFWFIVSVSWRVRPRLAQPPANIKGTARLLANCLLTVTRAGGQLHDVHSNLTHEILSHTTSQFLIRTCGDFFNGEKG